MKKLVLISFTLLFAVVLFSCSNEAPNEIVGNEKGVGYISLKLPPIGGSSRAASNNDIKAIVDDYTLVLMSDEHTSTSLRYSQQEHGFDKIALPVGTYQIILTAETLGATYGYSTPYTTVGIAYTENVVIEEFKMTKVSMTLSVPELVIEMPEEDIYINSSIIPRIKFDIKGLPSRSNTYVHYTPYVLQETQKNEEHIMNLISTGSWKKGKYGEFVDVPFSAPSVEGEYILGMHVQVGIGYADGNDNVLVGNLRFLCAGGISCSDFNHYYNEHMAIANQLYSRSFTATVPPTGIELNVGWEDETYSVQFSAGENGSVDCESIPNVERDTVLSVDGATITIGETVVTASPETGYVFDSWTGLPAGNTIVDDIIISAVFAVENE